MTPRHGRNDVFRIEFEQDEDGRWIAEIRTLPGVMAYGATQDEARAKVEVLALRTLADRLEHGETVPELGEIFVVACGDSGQQFLPASRSLFVVVPNA